MNRLVSNLRWALWALGVWYAVPRSAAGVDYAQKIQPLLQQRCYPCHSRVKQESGLRLDAGVLVHRGSQNGSVLARDQGEGELVRRITTSDPNDRMPPEGKALSAEEVDRLRAWVAEGARFPAEETIPPLPSEHWAFQPVRRPAIPVVRDVRWPRNPIDAFVLVQLESRGWHPAPPASPTALLRRVLLDLTGLPPTLEEQDAFLRDPSPERLDRMIDEALARPTYGERWARHWLDLVRYADSNGYERDAEKPFVWRYRDYVIRALNADRPYDQFLREQLAGDELPEVTSETVLATGFTRLGHWDDEPADPATDRYDQLDDIVSTTGQAVLGLTIGCARCHDHKFEPLTAKDYYQLVAVFAPLQRPQSGRTELTIPAGSPAEVAALAQREAAMAQWRQRTNEFSAAEIEARLHTLRTEVPDLPAGYVLRETGAAPPKTHVLVRGTVTRPGAEVEPGVPTIFTRPAWTSPQATSRTSGRRLALAEWITRPEHPLTARVLVNRVWQQHFGVGLVRTASDFGTMGEPPTHPELLDWLADWFVHEGGWSLKELHRLILSSETWRMSRTSRPEYEAADPENRWLWHQSYRRLEVEALRDSILAVSGALNRQQFGRGVFLPVPAAAMEANTDKDSIWQVSSPEETSRRTVYAFVKRGLVVPMLEVLDLCDTVSSSPRRQVTTVAPQALTLFNGEFVNEQARVLAERLEREMPGNPEGQIERAYQLALGRLPSASERAALREFLEAGPESERAERRIQFGRVLFNLNEFAYPE